MTRTSINKKTIWILVIFTFITVVSLPTVVLYIKANFIELDNNVKQLTKLKDEFESVYQIYSSQAKHRKNLFLRGHVKKYLKRYTKTVYKASEDIYKKLDLIYKNPLAVGYIQKTKDIEKSHRDMMKKYNEALKVFKKDFDFYKADRYTSGYGKNIGKDLLAIIKDIEKQGTASINEKSYNMQTNLNILSIGATIGYLLLALILAKIVLHPLKRIAKFAANVKEVNPDNLDDYNEYKKDKNDEIGDLIEVVNNFANTIIYYSANLEMKVQERTLELEKANQAIKENQSQLIQSEKMAGLGQLVASIAHEINTPAGAISGAIGELENDSINLEKLSSIYYSLDVKDRNILLRALELTRNYEQISTRDQRSTAKKIKEDIDSINPDANSRKISKDLASIGIKEDGFQEFSYLYGLSNFEDIHKAIVESGNTKVHIRDIKIGISRITHLIKALKGYSRLDKGEISDVKLEEGIENTLIILNHKIKQNIKVVREFEDIPIIRANEEQLNQVWTNIINNATQVLQGDDSVLTIRIKKEDDENVLVEIENNNGEIPEDIRSKIFDAYFTTKAKGEGTGIGLSICKDIIEKQHNGKLECICVNNTTCFKATIPINSVSAVS